MIEAVEFNMHLRPHCRSLLVDAKLLPVLMPSMNAIGGRVPSSRVEL